VLFFFFVLLVMFYGGSVLQACNILIGLLATQWVLLFVPALIVLWYVRARFRTALFLRLMSLPQALAVLLIAFSWVVLIIQASIWQNRVLPVPESVVEAFREILSVAGEQPLFIVLFIIALSPAICEELVFRGVIPCWWLASCSASTISASTASCRRHSPACC
jgi:sodium transport system permease protein